MFNAEDASANGGRVVPADQIPAAILRIMSEMGIDPNQARVIDMSSTGEEIPDDARFLGEVVAGDAMYNYNPAVPEGYKLSEEAIEYGQHCGDPDCPACYEPIGYTPNEETAAAMQDVRDGRTEDATEFFRKLTERMEARSLNQEADPVPQQDEGFPDKDDAAPEAHSGPQPFLMGEDPNFDREIIERLVGGQISLQASVDATFGVLKKLLEPEELEQVDHITGFHLAVEQAAQINRADIIGQAKGFVLGRYGFEWEDVPYEQQRQVIEFFEAKNDAE